MKAVNRAMISGNLVKQAVVRKTKAGIPVASFTVAVDNRHRDRRTGKVLSDPNFVECTMFGEEALAWAPRLAKGAEVSVAGSLRSSKWERDGDVKFSTDILVEALTVAERPPKAAGSGAKAKPEPGRGRAAAPEPKPEPKPEPAPEPEPEAVPEPEQAPERAPEPEAQRPAEPEPQPEPEPEPEPGQAPEPEEEPYDPEDDWDIDLDLGFDLGLDDFDEE